MGSRTLVCVQGVKQEAHEEWDESMPLPGDIIEGISADDDDALFVQAKTKSELSSQLGKISLKGDLDPIWIKVKRDDNTLKLRVNIVPEKSSLLHRRYTIKASTDERHVVVIGDLTLEQCMELQEISRRMVNVECRGFSKKGVEYDWKMKMHSYLPDQQCSIINSILFTAMSDEYCIEATTARCMAWFSAAISSGVPLVFVNIQTEQIITKEKDQRVGRGSIWGTFQNHNATAQTMQGIRLWFLPGVAEVATEMKLEPGELRFGMDVKRTDEGFVCVCSVTKGSAADRAGVWDLCEEANRSGRLLVLSRLEGKSLMPASACSAGLIQCCDDIEIKDTLGLAIDQMGSIQFHFMAWPNQTSPGKTTKAVGVAPLLPPE